jgi:RHS repeat-associated protein
LRVGFNVSKISPRSYNCVKPDGSVVAYDWDANGNMIARTEGNQMTEFEYDYDNRLVRIVYPNGSEVRFGYDGLGRRVFRQEGANVRYFYYDGDRIIAEREGSSWVVRYLLGLEPCGHVVSGQVRVYHADRLGSVRWVTDGSGNLVASYVYEGFGKIVGQGGSEVVPYRFCGLWGYRNDGDAGLLHVGARYYEVETGRWVQKDVQLGSSFNSQTLNLFTYSINNPINLFDPDGENAAVGALVLYNPATVILIVGGIVLVGGLLIIWYALPKPPEIDWRTGRPKGKGWEKQGKEWVNKKTKERVHPDLNSEDHGPHVDYTDSKGGRWRVYPDGRIEPKK